jgi:hypothetical protein
MNAMKGFGKDAFGGAIADNTPEIAQHGAYSIMGQFVDSPHGLLEALSEVGKGARVENIDPTNAHVAASKAAPDLKGTFVRATPPSYVPRKEGEKYDIEYRYDREKNENIGFKMG